MNIIQMRLRLLDAYPGPRWAAKVNAMTEGQVIAVYRRLQLQNKI